MKVQQLSSKLVRPVVYNGDHPPLTTTTTTTTNCVPLSVFDRFTYDTYIPSIYAYKPPNPSNKLLEQGLRKVLSEYRELAGRFDTDNINNRRVILLNDEGVRFIEASMDCSLDQLLPFKPSTLLGLSPSSQGVKELLLVQLTRFSCGSLVLCWSSNHMLADGVSMSQFVVSWGKACRGLEIEPRPLHDRTIFPPRNPPKVEYDHSSIEFTKREIKEEFSPPPDIDSSSGNELIYHKAHFTPEFIAKLKNEASSSSGLIYSTFEILVAHLWRIMTSVRKIPDEFQRTCLRIAVDGRRRLRPRVPDEYFGNVVLWALPTARVKDILQEPLSNAAKIVHEGVAKLNDDYFKSFIDFASNDHLDEEDLIAEAHKIVPFFCPDLEVDSWLGFPHDNVDFGVGKPFLFMPSFYPLEGLVYLVPSFTGEEGIDAFITMYQQQLGLFEEICYSLD